MDGLIKRISSAIPGINTNGTKSKCSICGGSSRECILTEIVYATFIRAANELPGLFSSGRKLVVIVRSDKIDAYYDGFLGYTFEELSILMNITKGGCPRMINNQILVLNSYLSGAIAVAKVLHRKK